MLLLQRLTVEPVLIQFRYATCIYDDDFNENKLMLMDWHMLKFYLLNLSFIQNQQSENTLDSL